METKGNTRGLRLPDTHKQYTDIGGNKMKFPQLTSNTPRFNGTRTGKDAEFLSFNDGKLQILQQ